MALFYVHVEYCMDQSTSIRAVDADSWQEAALFVLDTADEVIRLTAVYCEEGIDYLPQMDASTSAEQRDAISTDIACMYSDA